MQSKRFPLLIDHTESSLKSFKGPVVGQRTGYSDGIDLDGLASFVAWVQRAVVTQHRRLGS
ncbi:hypothetical protein ACIBJF_23590 [Streptomyces sp. NPDC050743]|uniref:hypothetical protein n=1 Tax=Streptomyces sp. NPDC050743 TaxID=3365634 RepID=UPI0037A8CC50